MKEDDHNQIAIQGEKGGTGREHTWRKGDFCSAILAVSVGVVLCLEAKHVGNAMIGT